MPAPLTKGLPSCADCRHLPDGTVPCPYYDECKGSQNADGWESKLPTCVPSRPISLDRIHLRIKQYKDNTRKDVRDAQTRGQTAGG